MDSFRNNDDTIDRSENPKSSFFNRSLTSHHQSSGLSLLEYGALERMGSLKKLNNSPFGSTVSAGNSLKGKVRRLCSIFEKPHHNHSQPDSQSPQTSPIPSPKPTKLQNCDSSFYSSDSFYPFRLPGTEDRVVIYFTSLRGIRKTYADCYAVRMIFKGFRVNLDERDISMDSAYRKELQSVLEEKTVSLPQVFIKGKHIGGADVVRQLNETGELAKMLKGLPIRTLKPGLGYMCEGCGDMRFVPCPNCSGSRKVFDEDEEKLKRCPDCNENGLVRCSECCVCPFAEDKLFVLTLSAGLEGYHINVDGKHITSFPYHPGFTLEDATGLYINGDVDVHSLFAASLPTSHPSFSPQKHLEMQTKWQAPPLPSGPVELFIGILSAGNHFAERMAVRKSWLQHGSIKSSEVVARFFVAMHRRKEVNVELMKEAEFFGDIIIVPYMDNYDLVVLKTVAICEYGVNTVAAEYIMKCDDDTFVRINAILNEVKKARGNRSLYVGNINYYHRPLRHGKWAVTYEEWPEEVYPPYANGPGYVLSSDIAKNVVSDFEKHKLRLFKMEDVSMGMWVEQFNNSKPVKYVHSLKFCQFGCIEDYYTAHYQSPRQMICLWRKLQKQGRPHCCNMR